MPTRTHDCGPRTEGTYGNWAVIGRGLLAWVLGIVPLGQLGVALGGSGWSAGAEAAEHAGVLEAGGAGGGLDSGAVADQVLGSLQP